jgi:tetratricopeptide (TPR) repeat protein
VSRKFTDPAPPREDAVLRSVILCLLLAASTAWVYADSLRFDFVSYDDPGYVLDNASVALGISRGGLRYALLSTDMGNWQPLNWLSYMLDYELYGLRAGGYHATNLILHILNTLLLFWILRGMTRAEWSSALVAALFGLHPLHVESVAWIAERKDVLSTFFALLAMAAYAAYARRPSPARFLTVALCFVLGLMAKPMLVTLPLLFLLLDHWPLARWRRNFASARSLVIEKIPLLVISLAFGLLTLAVHHSRATLAYRIVGQEIVGLSGVNLANAIVSYIRYLGKTLWPSELSVLYPHPALTESGGVPLEAWEVAIAAALLALISVGVFKSRRPYMVMGWSWYLVSLLPVIGIFQTGAQAMADRYTYIPLIGIFIAVVWGIAEWVARWRPGGRNLAPAAGVAAIVLLALYAAAAQRAVQPWRGSLPLYENALYLNPRNNLIRLNLGNALTERGEIEQGIEQYRMAIEVDSDYVDAHHNLGFALATERRYSEAIAHYGEALRVRPDYAITHKRLGEALREQGHNERAAHHLRRAIEFGLGSQQIHYDLANLLRENGDLPGATEHYQKTLQIDPNHSGARRALDSLHERAP